MKRSFYFLILLFIGFGFVFQPVNATAGEKVKGKVVLIDPQKKMVIIKDRKAQKWTIFFESERVFRRFKRLKIRKGDKVLIRFYRKGGRLIGTYVRSLEGC